jgi:hypothetical protein
VAQRTERPGFLRLHAFKALQSGNLLKTGNVLTQRPQRSAMAPIVANQRAGGQLPGHVSLHPIERILAAIYSATAMVERLGRFSKIRTRDSP